MTFIFISLIAQIDAPYEPSATQPYGVLNPEAPSETGDFAPMIGLCNCRSVSRNQDGTWADTLNMTWKFKYIMNGTAVQDEVWRENGLYAGSIRQFHQDSGVWIVSYFSNPGTSFTPGIWRGKKADNQIVLYQDQKAPNGMDGDSRLTFYEMDGEGFKWKGEWVSKNGQFTYPFWMIECKKRSG